MADLNSITVSVKVAQFESFSKAARSLGMPVSTKLHAFLGALAVWQSPLWTSGLSKQ